MKSADKATFLAALADDDELIEVGRKAIEDALVEFRNGHLSEVGRGNGLVIFQKNGTPSDVIRFGPEMALSIGLKAIAERCGRE